METVEVLVDSALDGAATYGLSRPDVREDYPNAPVGTGFTYSLDTTRYENGTHTLFVRATDSSGNLSVFPGVTVAVSN